MCSVRIPNPDSVNARTDGHCGEQPCEYRQVPVLAAYYVEPRRVSVCLSTGKLRPEAWKAGELTLVHPPCEKARDTLSVINGRKLVRKACLHLYDIYRSELPVRLPFSARPFLNTGRAKPREKLT